MLIKKINQQVHYRPLDQVIKRTPPESEETKLIRQTGMETNLIKAQTEAIKKGDITKPVGTDSSFYLKKLNVI